MPNSDINIAINAEVGSVSTGLKATTEGTGELSKSLKAAGDEGEILGTKISESLGRSGRASQEARGSLMLLGDTVGVHLPREVNTLIASFGNLGPVLAGAIPALAFVSIAQHIGEVIEKQEKLNEEIRKSAEENEKLTVQESDRTAGLEVTNLRLEDQINTLENRPTQNKLAEALIESRIRTDSLALSLDSVLEKTDELLEPKISSWNAFKDSVEGAAKALLLGGGPAGAGETVAAVYTVRDAYQKLEEQKKRVADAELAHSEAKTEDEQKRTIKQLHDAYSGLRDASDTALKTTQALAPDSAKEIGQLHQNVIAAANGMERMDLAAKELGLSLHLVKAQSAEEDLKRNERIIDGALARYRRDAKEADEALKKKKKKKKAQEEDEKLTQDGFRVLNEMEAKRVEGERRAGEALGKIYERTTEEHQRSVEALAEEGVTARRGQGLITAQEEFEQLKTIHEKTHADQVKFLQEQKATAATDPNLTKDQRVVKEAEIDAQIERLNDTHNAKMAKANDQFLKQQEARERQYVDQLNAEFSSTFARIATGQETLGKGTQRMFQSMEQSALQSLVKIAAEEVEATLLHKTLTEQQKLEDAKAAAAKGWKWGMDMPFPANLVIAPTLAATAFAGAMAFESGGIVPETQMALVHKNETVIPAHLSEAFQNLAAGDGGRGQGDVHLHVHAVDASGVENFFRKNAPALGKGMHHAISHGHFSVERAVRGK